MSVRKYNAVRRLSRWSAYPRTFAAIIESLPSVIWSQMTARAIAELIERWQTSRESGHTLGYVDAQV